ncbi:unnamed protein product, partial [Mesorhabditis belari]|uniref:SEC7 domain-containing protein n=1 Tax=Mesorhabditis belari TaxID=2138241 RepID=A0AAF3E9M3_9BILA
MAVNGIYVVLGEANALIALLKKARRYWHSVQAPTVLEDTDPLLRSLADLKDVLNNVSALADVAPQAFLSPFLEIVRSQNTNGPITEAALAAVARFLNYGLIDAHSIKSAQAVESIAQAVTHTKFIGGANAGSDECVLFKILQVLRSLLLSPVGSLLSNEAVCDMMQSCFRICFEQNLSEMLRKAAESTLSDMTQLIFARLPDFEEDIRHPYIRKLVMSAKRDKRRRRRRRKSKIDVKQNDSEEEVDAEVTEINEAKQELDQVVDELSRPRTSSQLMVDLHATGMGYAVVLNTDEAIDITTKCDEGLQSCEGSKEAKEGEVLESSEADHNVPLISALRRERHHSPQHSPSDVSTGGGVLQMPYGLPCARELLRFLITLTNPLDRHNTEQMIVLGLNLLIVVLEASADHLSNYSLFLPLIKDELCRSLLQLLETEKLPILASTSRASFLLFESCRIHLKFQLEAYFNKLRAIVVSEQTSVSYEKKEIALDSIVQLWRIPGLVTELYLNYDCDLYCSNIFEDLTKLLVENAFPLHGLQSTSLLSLEALLVVIDNIEQNCVYRNAGSLPPSGVDCKQPVLQRPILSGMESAQRQTNPGQTGVDIELLTKLSSLRKFNRHAAISSQLSMSKILEQKKRKRIIAEGTEVFNQSPKKGIEFLREKGLLGADPESMVDWLRENPRLDKKMIADYICSRKHAAVLEAFVKSFSFEETRLDQALRMFLETFRLPGEAAEISMVMQHFSDHWYRVNNEPFNHPDAAFTLSYAIIMLNTDQHNPQVRRNQPPMTVDCFKRNLSGTNGKADFDSQMLEDIYAAIKTDEIVMPAEQTGIVKENYMWKVLLRRGESGEGNFTHAPIGWNDHDLFAIAWGPAIAAFSYVYDKSQNDIILQKALNGYRKCALIAAHYGMSDVFDNLIIHLCKFSTLMPKSEGVGEETLELQRQRSAGSELSLQDTPEAIAIRFGENQKAHMAARAFFELVHNHGDILREGWKNVIECLIQLFRARLLPPELTEVEDFVDPKGWVSLIRVHHKQLPISRSEAGLLSWFGLGGGSNESQGVKRPTAEQENSIKTAEQVIHDCRPGQLVGDSKYLTNSSLSELLSAISQASHAIVQHADNGMQNPVRIEPLSPVDEDALVFHLETIVNITQENKDRISMVWPVLRRHIDWLLSKRFGKNPLLVERAVVGLLRVINRNLFRDTEVTTKEMLLSLTLILTLPPQAISILSKQIAYGLHSLIQNNAANIHNKDDWNILFSLLEASGAAVLPEDIFNETRAGMPERNAHSDGELMLAKPKPELE